MANNCDTSLHIVSDKEITDEQYTAIAADIKETIEYTGGQCDTVDDNSMEWNGDTRWAIHSDEIAALAKKHSVSIRAIGREDGVGFVQVVCADDKGNIIQDKEIAYAL